MKYDKVWLLRLQYNDQSCQMELDLQPLNSTKQIHLPEKEMMETENEKSVSGVQRKGGYIKKIKIESLTYMLIAVRDLFHSFAKESREFQKLVEKDWMDILDPDYDSSWFMEGMTEEEWEIALQKNMQIILDKHANYGLEVVSSNL